MKITLQTVVLAASFILLSMGVSAQVKGVASLQNAGDQSGIKVVFYPKSPTAVLDSTYTNSKGEYSIAIKAGIYTIRFTKDGFQDYLYKDFENVVLYGNDLLLRVELSKGVIKHVTGSVFGEWDKSFIYVIDGDVTIPADTSLLIHPGTKIRFSGLYNLIVLGKLKAVGTQNNKILFSSNKLVPQNEDWGAIKFMSTKQKSQLSYCVIEYGRVYSESSILDVTHNILRNSSDRCLDVYGGVAYIAYNKISNVVVGSAGRGTGIQIQFSNSVVEYNEIVNGGRIGLSLWGDNSIAQNNKISAVTAEFGYGIHLGGPNSTALVQNNVIVNCKTGIAIEGWYDVATRPNPTIINNTIVHNSENGVFFERDYATAKLYMNLIANNGTGINCSTAGANPSDVMYNNFYNNAINFSSTIPITGLGVILSTNNNSTPCDSYFNIMQDPLFETVLDTLKIKKNSPCVNAGGNLFVKSKRDVIGNVRIAHEVNIKDSIVDIGAYEYTTLSGSVVDSFCVDSVVDPIVDPVIVDPKPLVTDVTDSNMLQGLELFPSLARTEIWLKAAEEETVFAVELQTMDGKLLYQDTKYKLGAMLDISSLKSGLYLVKVCSSSQAKTFKFIKE